MEIPDGHFGYIVSKSGSVVKHFIEVCAGVIDSDYRGDV